MSSQSIGQAVQMAVRAASGPSAGVEPCPLSRFAPGAACFMGMDFGERAGLGLPET
jgi:hypothetical protein